MSIPVPHEPTFRASLARREDATNESFLALLASMIGTLVTSFPRSPRLHLKNAPEKFEFPRSMVLVKKCHDIAIRARGPGYLDRDLTVYDAAISYFLGLSAAHVYDMRACRLYFGECATILRIYNSFGVSKRLHSRNGTPYQAYPPDPFNVELPGGNQPDLISQELGRRLFYLNIVGFKALRQLGSTDVRIHIPPESPTEIYPPLPQEVDDEYIFPTHIDPQPIGTISQLTGFNANVRIYYSYSSLSTLEAAFGSDKLFDWERQKEVIGECLQKVKMCLADVPPELTIRKHQGPASVASSDGSPQEYHPWFDILSDRASVLHDSPRTIQCEIQKANIYASLLSTRSYLVEKYWSLHLAHKQSQMSSGLPSPSIFSETVEAGVDGMMKHEHHEGSRNTPDHISDMMADERESVVKDLLSMLKSINKVNMEPIGVSFLEQTHKVRQIASTLLNLPRTNKGDLGLEAQSYLSAFIDILNRLDRLGPTTTPAPSPGGGRVRDELARGNKSDTEEEEEKLREWASLKDFQQKFADVGGVMSEI
ncbi:hypothetical protein FQN54_009450 [Arachnomyces sp. PD_36]|nr:hypothetical protein FQN54_009450 [Arachnomyces sp. PD_36]